MSGSRYALVGCIAGVALLVLYVVAYVFLCLRAGDDDDRHGAATGEQLFVRGYRWQWCETAFIPAARVESIVRCRRVVVVADAQWCCRPWWAWWPLDG